MFNIPYYLQMLFVIVNINMSCLMQPQKIWLKNHFLKINMVLVKLCFG